MRLAILIAALLAGCTAAPEATDASQQTPIADEFVPEPYTVRETHELRDGLDQSWTFEAHEGATVVAHFYTTGQDSIFGQGFCFKAKTPSGTSNQCPEGNANVQIGPAMVLGKTYYQNTSGPGLYAFSASTPLAAGQFHVEIDVTYP